MTFEEWLAALDEIAGECEDNLTFTELTGAECWKEAFDEGVSPQDAWSEDPLRQGSEPT